MYTTVNLLSDFWIQTGYRELAVVAVWRAVLLRGGPCCPVVAVRRAVLLRGASASGPCPSELVLSLVCCSARLRRSALRPSKVTDSLAGLQ